MGGINHQEWVIYDIAIPTLPDIFMECYLFVASEASLHQEMIAASLADKSPVNDVKGTNANNDLFALDATL